MSRAARRVIEEAELLPDEKEAIEEFLSGRAEIISLEEFKELLSMPLHEALRRLE